MASKPGDCRGGADFIISEFNRLHQPRLCVEWTEEDGDVLWWQFPISAPPYCGSPLSSSWPGYIHFTHFTRLPDAELVMIKGAIS